VFDVGLGLLRGVGQVENTVRESFNAEFVRKESGLTLSGVLHATHGYIRNL